MNDSINIDQSTDVESLLGEAAEAFRQELAAGNSPDIDDFANRYPAIADVLRQVLPALAVLDKSQAGNLPPQITSHDGRLGDFELLKGIGRGGMGAVYEAWQMSLQRRVALKVLPFAAVLDSRALARFRNEAQAAATLKHPNIVSVYSIGTDRGVHFYAMELIEGQSLAEVIEELRAKSPVSRDGRPDEFVVRSSSSAAKEALPSEQPTTNESSSLSSQSDTEVAAALSTIRTTHPKRYYRRVAEMGIQAARALDHAHQHGIIRC